VAEGEKVRLKLAEKVESIKLGEVVGRRLAALQQERGVRDSDLARITGISNAYFNRLKAGKYDDPGVGMLISIAAALNVQPAELIGDELQSVELPLPAPNAYFAAQYGITSPDLAQYVDVLARQLAASENPGAAPTRHDRNLLKKALNRFQRAFTMPLEDEAMPTAQTNDSELTRLLAAWSSLSLDARNVLLLTAEQFNKER